ncbi:MAG: endonuclease III [Acidobacteriota bacterium]
MAKITKKKAPKQIGKPTDPPESLDEKKARAERLIRGLRELYPDADCALQHKSALQLLVATILSAQCTDERVNRVTPKLFAKYKDAQAYANADPDELEELIRTTGFFRNKTRSILGLGRSLVERYGSEVPRQMTDLVKLPGVGRKTANVLRGTWFGLAGITVDTHVKRLSGRMELTCETDPVKIEFELQEMFPEKDWTFTSHALIWHGRRVCNARRPECDRCTLRPDCPFPKR